MSARLPARFWIASAVVALYVATGLFAGLIAPYGQAEIASPEPFAPWGAPFLLGTDQLGRDVLSRLVFGARNSLGIALVTTIATFLLGATTGAVAALSRPRIDAALSRAVEVAMAVPPLIAALVLLAILGTSIPNLILIIALVEATRVFRLARAATHNVAVMDYIEAARLRGESLAWIVFHEVLPNIASTLAAEFGLRFCFVFLLMSALSFLGLGIQPPTADWGSMVRENATLITYGDPTPLLPAAAIAILTISVNVLVDCYVHLRSGGDDEA